MQDPRIGGPLQRDRREGVRRRLGISAAISAALDDRDPDGIVGLVFGVHGAEEGAAVVVPTVQVAEEVAGGHGGPVDIDLQFEGAHFGFDDDPHGIVGCWWGEREAAGHERQQGEESDHRPSRCGVKGSAPRCSAVCQVSALCPLPLTT